MIAMATNKIIMQKDQGPVCGRYVQIIERTQPNTKHRYYKRFCSLYQQFNKKGGDESWLLLIEAIKDKRAKGLLTHSTVRQYKASINYALACLCAIHKNQHKLIPNEQLSFFEQLTNVLSMQDVDRISLVLVDLGEETSEELHYRNRQAVKNNLTSTQRMKHLPKEIYELVVQDSHPTRALLREFVFFNSLFGLRPKEWLSAQLLTLDEYKQKDISQTAPRITPLQKQNLMGRFGADTDIWFANNSDVDANNGANCVLMVKNGKYSHGRACGEYRYLHLYLGPKTQQRLAYFISNMQLDNKKQKDKDGRSIITLMQEQFRDFLSEGVVYQVLTSMYARRRAVYDLLSRKRVVHNRIFKGRPPTLQYPTLYSTRHQAIADQKQAGLDAISIAAIFGHISPHTANKHYANKRYGSSPIKIQPDPYNIALVVSNVVENQHEAVSTPSTPYQEISTHIQNNTQPRDFDMGL